MHTSRAQDI